MDCEKLDVVMLISGGFYSTAYEAVHIQGGGKPDDSSPTVKLSLEGECSEEGGSGRLNAALRQAVSSGDKEAIRLLLSEGADVNYCDDANSAVIFCAIDGGAVSILDLLISNGANIELRDTHGYTPLMRAAKAGKAGMVESLLAAGKQFPHLTLSASVLSNERVKVRRQWTSY
ncbi:Ankyrin repeat and KH domain-containing protein 1 [Taenia crassiceps]|uniref:Ankyrin repeat and KH domain-containing protein 1 n=1 Tax=Taenia crassiceps TaxID=6207 RepID=A0ABR4Q3A7_9CEST